MSFDGFVCAEPFARKLIVALGPRARRIASDLGAARPARIKLAGDLGAIAAPDLLQLLSMTRRSGLLLVTSERGERGLLFDEGSLSWASSTLLAERTNEIFCRLNLLDRAAALLRPLGTDPIRALRRQIGCVVRGLVAEKIGTFALLEVTPPAGPAVFDTQEMLLGALCAEDEERR